MGPSAYFMPQESPSAGGGRPLKPPAKFGDFESRKKCTLILCPSVKNPRRNGCLMGPTDSVRAYQCASEQGKGRSEFFPIM